jgi:methyltransferase
MTLSILVLALVTLQRLGELLYARHNTRRLLARGAYETGAEHYPAMVTLHAAWLAGLWFLAWDRPVQPGWLALFLGLQLLRVWVLATLGERWTTRIIVLPGAALIATGPYRLLRHPNYVIVIGEIAALPLAFDLTAYAVLFSLLNAAMLWVRIGVENRIVSHPQL